MPVEMIETIDSLTNIVQFRTSLVYEMIVSLHTLVAGRRHLSWASQARSALDATFWSEVDTIYRPFHEGVVLFEFPVNYRNQQDVPGFIKYVRAMDPATFIFYFIGRVIPLDDLIRTNLDRDFIMEHVRLYCEMYAHPMYSYAEELKEILPNVPAYQARLTNLWERYWNEFFHSQVDSLAEHWEIAIADKQNILAHNGGYALLDMVSGKKALPDNLPSDQPVTELTYIPLYYVTAPSYMFFGYGNVTVLFDSEATLARLSEIERRKDEAVQVAKALSDNTRLSILKLIAQRDGLMHGKRIASKLDLSPSSVSRQLAQLRDSGLIREERHDDQTVTYNLVKDAITSLPEKILDYLFS